MRWLTAFSCTEHTLHTVLFFKEPALHPPKASGPRPLVLFEQAARCAHILERMPGIDQRPRRNAERSFVQVFLEEVPELRCAIGKEHHRQVGTLRSESCNVALKPVHQSLHLPMGERLDAAWRRRHASIANRVKGLALPVVKRDRRAIRHSVVAGDLRRRRPGLPLLLAERCPRACIEPRPCVAFGSNAWRKLRAHGRWLRRDRLFHRNRRTIDGHADGPRFIRHP